MQQKGEELDHGTFIFNKIFEIYPILLGKLVQTVRYFTVVPLNLEQCLWTLQGWGMDFEVEIKTAACSTAH